MPDFQQQLTHLNTMQRAAMQRWAQSRNYVQQCNVNAFSIAAKKTHLHNATNWP